MKARILKKFEDEIHQLDKELKTELPKEIKRARELGDLRENAEYQAAKERQRLVEARISMLQKRVSEISLMNLDRIPHDKVGFGSTVTCKDRTAQTDRLSAGDAGRRRRRPGLISTASPIGRALLNKEEGDEVGREDAERQPPLRGHEARHHPRRRREPAAVITPDSPDRRVFDAPADRARADRLGHRRARTTPACCARCTKRA